MQLAHGSMYLNALIGSYRIRRELGVGGMGVVYEGEHMLLKHTVAIKVLLPQMAANHDIVRRFFNEAKAVTAIADPGIVQIYDFGVHTDGAPYIVMELLCGDSLARRLELVSALRPLDAVRLARQIAASLSAAHARGIIHRDLKPENVFVVGDISITGGERTKVLDFGVAKQSTHVDRWKTQTGMLIGTPSYMSPEQCRGAGVVDARSDVYALGCLLMTMVTGRPPFVAEACGDLIVAHLREPAPLASSRVRGIAAAVDDIVQRCLAKAPDDRFASMAELGEALAAAEREILTAAATVAVVPVAFAAPAKATPTTLGGSAAQAITRGTRATRAARITGVAACVLALVGVARLTASRADAPARVMDASSEEPVAARDPFARSPPMPDSVEPTTAPRPSAPTPRVSHVTLALPPARAVPSGVLSCDGVVVAANQPISLDGGDHEVIARAPGRVTWKNIVHVPAAAEIVIEVPRLHAPKPPPVDTPPPRELLPPVDMP